MPIAKTPLSSVDNSNMGKSRKSKDKRCATILCPAKGEIVHYNKFSNDIRNCEFNCTLL